MRERNVSVAGVLFEREYFSGRERVVVAARITNRGSDAVENLDVSLEIEGREIERLGTDLPPNGSATVEFAPVTLGEASMTGAVRAEGDALPTDDVFYFNVSPGQVVTVLVVENDRASSEAALYLTRALGVGSTPAFDVSTTTGRQLRRLRPCRPRSGRVERHAAALRTNRSGADSVR